MKKIILSACVMFITIAAYGQRDKGTVTLQPKVGLNMATLTNEIMMPTQDLRLLLVPK